jgi:hypothetical protein
MEKLKRRRMAMTDQECESRPQDAGTIEPEQRERRNFLLGLGKWSKAVIGGVVMGGLLAPGRDAQAQTLGWANSNNGDNTWVNFGGGWSWGPGWNNWPGQWNNGGWLNRPWYNGGWHNRPWHNGGGWYNGGGRHHRDWRNRGGRHRDWYNGRHNGGRSWINR